MAKTSKKSPKDSKSDNQSAEQDETLSSEKAPVEKPDATDKASEENNTEEILAEEAISQGDESVTTENTAQDSDAAVDELDSLSEDITSDINWDDFSFDDFSSDFGQNDAESTETPIDMSEVTQGFDLDEAETAEVFSDEPDISSKDELTLMVEDKVEEVKAFVEENKTAVQVSAGVVILLILFWLFSPSKDTSQLEDISKVAEQATSIDNELKRFEAEFSQLSVDESNKVKELDNKVTVLFETLKDNKEELAEQRKSINELTVSFKQLLEQRKKSSKYKEANKKAKYTIAAIVPGRVWLRSENGDEFTATVGDDLGDLGVIIKIEPHYGRVKTSSGIVIKLGEYDG